LGSLIASRKNAEPGAAADGGRDAGLSEFLVSQRGRRCRAVAFGGGRAMEKPTFASVTKDPCTCGFLQEQADDPTSPIVYDAELNEYYFEYPSPCGDGECGREKATLMIYHCPFCGGAAPEPKRDLLFAVIPPGEERRLYKLLGGIKTLDQATQALGPPDDDNPHGLTETQVEREGTAPTVESFQTLRYSGLSGTADVYITETRTGGVHFWLQGKYLGPPLDGSHAEPDAAPDRGGT
jgi:hypothetical protein